METLSFSAIINSNNNNFINPIQVQSKELTEVELKTIEIIKKCLEIFNLNNRDGIALDLLIQLKAKEPLDNEDIPYKIELIRQTDGNNTIEKIYHLNQVFFRCLGLKSNYFNALIERNFLESTEKHLKLSNISAEEFEMLIQNVFQPEFDRNNVSTLLEVSHQFAFFELNKNCEDWLFNIFNKEDHQNFIEHLEGHNSPQILNILAKIAPKHLKELTRISYNNFIRLAKLCVKLEIKKLDLSNSLINECLEAIPSTVESLNLSRALLIKDDDLRFLKNTLKHLNLSECGKITDEGLKNLEFLKNLQNLDLSSCEKITDEGLKNLGPLKNLQDLNLSECRKITDEGLKNLESLTKLQRLNLSECRKITDEGLKNLESLTKLQRLNLSWCEITDEGLKNLESLTNLEYLNLSGCEITDEGIKYLQRLKNLRHLTIYRCKKITIAGLKNLDPLNLPYLDFSLCK